MPSKSFWLVPIALVGCTTEPYPPPQAPYASPYQVQQPTSEPYSSTYQLQQPISETYDSYAYDYAPQYIDISASLVGSEVPDLTIFYDQLSPYGSWYDDPDYGYVFAPQDASFIPYSNGYWTDTDYGWTWVSNEPFGWATSHYGRWLWRNRWVWCPDTHWGTAWVQWRIGDNYVGWAPMGFDEYATYVPEQAWRFVPVTELTRRDLPRYYATDYRTGLAQTRPLWRFHRSGDRSWVAGPGDDFLRSHRIEPRRERVDLAAIGRLDDQRRREAEQRARSYRQSAQFRDRLQREEAVRPFIERRVQEAEQERQRRATEFRRLDEQRQRAVQEGRQIEQRQRALDEQQRRATDQAARMRAMEERQRLEQQRRQLDEQARRVNDEERQRANQLRMQDEQRQRAAQQQLLNQQRRIEQQRTQDEQRRRGEQQRLQEQQRVEQQRMQQERQRAEQQQRMQDEQRRRADQQRMQEEQRCGEQERVL